MTTTSDETGLMGAILDNPADDAPRLIFADWLEDSDPARAEFIRLQIGLKAKGYPGPLTLRTARLGVISNSEHVPEALSACRLLHQHAPAWLGGLMFAGMIKVVDEGMGWARGFVHSIAIPTATLFGGPCERCKGRKQVPEEFECRVCGAQPDRDGQVEHGGGCYTQSEDGGGSEGVEMLDCPACHGSGRTPGCAAAIFAAHPVVRCVLTDREPARLEAGRLRPLSMWQHYIEDGRDEFHWRLPDPILRLVWDDPMAVDKATLTEAAGTCRNVYFDTNDAALDALSAAAVAHGRRLAGLPPLGAKLEAV